MKLTDLKKRPDSPEEAQQRIDYLQAEKQKVSQKVADLEDEVEALEDEAANVAFADQLEQTSNSGNTFRKLANKRNELTAKKGAFEKLESHLKEARKQKTLAMAQQKRNEAQKLNEEAASIEKERDKLLKKLEEVENCTFVPYIRTWSGQPLETMSTEFSRKLVPPKSERLRNQAQSLIKEAEQLERQTKSAKQPVS